MTFGPPVVSRADVDALPLHRLPKLWLAAAYCYEIEGDTLIPDAAFDYLSLRLDREWDRVPDPHGHLRVIERAALGSSSAGYLLDRDYPPLARGYAQALMMAWHNRPIVYRLLPPGLWAGVNANATREEIRPETSIADALTGAAQLSLF